MKFLITPDSFKESMSAVCAAKVIEKGVKRIAPDAQCIMVPMADGGEGTAECLMFGQSGEKVNCSARNPLGETIVTDFVWFEKKKTAIIEVAKACGMMLIPSEKKNPKIATSYGVGELIKEALKKECKEIILTLGGTVTNDGGSGMLMALGGKLLDQDGKNINPGGLALSQIRTIDLSEPIALLKDIKVTVLCDVKNKLLGENGATYVFGPQKGVTKNELPVLEAAMEHYSQKINEVIGKNVADMEGAGAAGGLGNALFAISKTEFVSGAEYVMKSLELEEKIKECDYVITGEGAIDSQSLQGKVPISISNIAKRYQKPVIVFVGKISGPMDEIYRNGVTAIFCILRGLKPMQKIFEEAEENLQLAVENYVRVLVNK
jgi:glycerate kinase